jgi:hypothetical protein
MVDPAASFAPHCGRRSFGNWTIEELARHGYKISPGTAVPVDLTGASTRQHRGGSML